MAATVVGPAAAGGPRLDRGATMPPEPDPPARPTGEEPVVDLDTWERAGRAVVATIPVETCDGYAPE